MVKVKEVEGRLVCTFPERMNTLACQAHGPQLLDEIARAQKPVTFDMKGVISVASSFLRLCLCTLKTLGPEKLVLDNASPEVKKAIMLAKMDSFLIMQ